MPSNRKRDNWKAQYLCSMESVLDFPFPRFKVGFNGIGNVMPSVVMLNNPFVLSRFVLWPSLAQGSAQSHQFSSIPFPVVVPLVLTACNK